MVRLEGSIKRFIADTPDDLPRDGMFIDGVVVGNDDIPNGSSCLVLSSGRIYRYKDRAWSFGMMEDSQELLLAAILNEIRNLSANIALVTA